MRREANVNEKEPRAKSKSQPDEREKVPETDPQRHLLHMHISCSDYWVALNSLGTVSSENRFDRVSQAYFA